MVEDIFGLDLGFEQSKVFSQCCNFKYLSMIGNPSAFELEQPKDKDPMNNLIVEFDNQVMYVGAKALETNNARLCVRTDKTNTEHDKAELYAALGHLHDVTGLDKCAIVTGLPIEDFKEEGLVEKVSQNMIGVKSFRFDKDKHPIVVDVKEVIVIPQSAGAFYSYVLDDEGKFIGDRMLAEVVIVVDVGYKTTDIITMKNCRYVSDKSCTIEKGMKDIHKELQRLIRANHGRKFMLSEMDEICRSKQFKDKGIVIDVSSLITLAESPVASAIINEAYALVGDTREADKVLACGGTMALLFPYFDEYYSHHIEKLPDLEYANASGYYKFGKMRYANKLTTKSKK